MKTKTPLKRSSSPSRQTALKTRTAVKKKRAEPRNGPMRDKEYRAWCRERNCVVCKNGKTFTGNNLLEVIDAAHTQNNGMGSKGPDSSCVPLCRGHHMQYDAGREAFEKAHGIDMKQEAQNHYGVYLIWKEYQ